MDLNVIGLNKVFRDYRRGDGKTHHGKDTLVYKKWDNYVIISGSLHLNWDNKYAIDTTEIFYRQHH